MKIQTLLIAAMCVAGHPAAIHAAPSIYPCPQSISAESVHVTAPDPAWQPYISSPLYLSGAAPADGPPEQLGVLREQTSAKTKAGWTQKYTLEGPYPDGKWLRCDYGAFGEVSLSKRLPDATQVCTVKGKKGAHAGENTIEIQCL